MSRVYVDLAVLGTIATALDNGASGLEDLADSVPSGIDAGPMTAVIAAMIAQVTDSAGEVSTALTSGAELVRQCRTYYRTVDEDSALGLAEIREVMTP
ncbi:hypothetical protein [Nocardioides abyssi]|uniref:ESX-1 secretion-associated protein n=1 Tax=Nocardioides abyssi TaxID=3058370 RepID=A0ABT8EVX5_9ACTN|nr:hypothetical protein [Nocardioides abyssi]MDN4162293.1 hypothetical protein [Nocardioides abyssi]